MDPRAILASEEVLRKIDAMCKRKCLDENEADECYLFILEKLAADDYQVLRQFKDQSSISTYLSTVMSNLVIDFLRERWTRRRVPGLVINLKGITQKIYHIICSDHKSFEEAHGILADDPSLNRTAKKEAEKYRLVELVKDLYDEEIRNENAPCSALELLCHFPEAVFKLTCWRKFSFDDVYDILTIEGKFRGSLPRYYGLVEPIREAPCQPKPVFKSSDDEEGPEISDPEAENPLSRVIEKREVGQRKIAIQVLQETVATLDHDDQLLVRLVYVSGKSMAKASRVLGISAPKAKKKLERLTVLFKEKLLAKGIREF